MLITTVSFFSFLLIMFLQQSVIDLKDLQFIASSTSEQSSGQTMYFSIKDKMVEYDLLNRKDDFYLLTRYRQPNLYQALLHLNYSLAYDFEQVKTTTGDNKLTISTEGVNLILDINGDKLPISFDTALTINSFTNQPKVALSVGNGMKIVDFSFEEIDNDVFKTLKAIPTTIKENNSPNLRRELAYVPNATGYTDKAFMNCMANLVEASYGKQHTAVEGTCMLTDSKGNGVSQSVLAFAGMNSITYTNYAWDVIYVIGSVADNFATFYNSYANNEPVKSYNPAKVYDYLVGHSAGGASALYAVLNGKLKARNIVTYGTPLTTKTGLTTPTTQFIKAQDDPDGCCVYAWWGGCKQYGTSMTDPVSQVAIGTHVNTVYLSKDGGSIKYLNCKATLPMTVWKTGLSLHVPFLDAYTQK